MTMERSAEKKSRSARLISYSSPLANAILFVVTFYVLSEHQSKLQRLQSLLEVSESRDPNVKRDSHDSQTDKLVLRSERQTGRTRVVSEVDKHIEGIVAWQLKTLRAQCLADEKICIQGPKGDSGVRGISGKMGPPGNKGEKGELGVKGEKGDRGSPGTTIAQPPVITKAPINVVAREDGKATFECQASANPRPSIRWRRLDDSPLPKARSAVSSNSTLTISKLHARDAGSYVCEAENIFGMTRAYATLAVQEPVSFIKLSPNVVNVSLGQNVTLDCLATGNPTPKVTWSGVDDLPESSRVESNGSLTIKNITQSDLRQYMCTAHNVLGRKSHSVTLRLDAIYSFDGSVAVHTTAILKCRLCSFAGFSLRWEKEGGHIASERAEQTDCTLSIRNTTLGDTGNYTCVATSKSGDELRQKIPLKITAAARITSYIPQTLVVRSGRRVSLPCVGVGPPAPDVFWTNGSKPINGSNPATLTIERASEDNAGIYRCHAVNHLGTDMKQTRIMISQLRFVQRPPPFVSFNVGESVSLLINCTASVGVDVHNEQPKISWSITSVDDGEANNVKVFSNGTLVIPYAHRCRHAVYNCSAEYDEEVISASVGDAATSWMLTSDRCGGFRQSTYDNSVYYAVSKSNTWDRTKDYSCPCGYHWATTDEGRKIFKSNNNLSGTFVYYNQCGWSGYRYGGVNRYYFRFRDSATTSAYKHAGNYDEYQLQFSSSTNSFTGIVCIKN
jgi:hypothetical protein